MKIVVFNTGDVLYFHIQICNFKWFAYNFRNWNPQIISKIVVSIKNTHNLIGATQNKAIPQGGFFQNWASSDRGELVAVGVS